MRPAPDNVPLNSAYLTRTDILLKRVLIYAGAVVVGIAAYVIVGLLAGV